MDKYIDYYNDSKKVTYHEQTDISKILKLRAVLKTLPDFCKDYFRAMDPLTTTKTRISYAYDIRIFFQFLLDENPAFKDYSMKDFTVDVLDQLKAIDIEEYQEYLKVYQQWCSRIIFLHTLKIASMHIIIHCLYLCLKLL